MQRMASSSPFAALRFLTDHGLPVGEVSRSYANTVCPHCGKTKLGLHLRKAVSTCFKCGWSPIETTISDLLGVPISKAKDILAAYAFSDSVDAVSHAPLVNVCPIPGKPLYGRYSAYLESRGFDPQKIGNDFGVLAAGRPCRWFGESTDWKGSDFSDRLIIPILDRYGRAVSFQGRTIRGDDPIRYRCPPLDRVPMHYKSLLYGASRVPGSTVVVVEGVMDAWRLGAGAVATFGTSLTIWQVRALSKYSRIIFAFDSEPEAQRLAGKYAVELAAIGRQVSVVDLELSDGRDMADLTDLEAGAVRRELGLS